jgi:energy-coupling factor transport system permease protein
MDVIMGKGVKYHPTTWIIWSLSASVAALLTRNPWYLLSLSIIAVLVRWYATGERPGGWFLRVYLSLLLFPALLNLIFSRSGETVLLDLPIRWIGGPYTLEALVFGLAAGVQIACLLTIMMVFSELVNAQDLLRRTPSALYPVGVTASIGLTFVPYARRAYEALKEAQQVRGYQPRGWRDLPNVVTPLVVLSLERAIAIAESLVSRGWGRKGLLGWQRAGLIAGLIGLVLTLATWVLFPSWGGEAVLLFGVSSLLLWFSLRVGNGSHRFSPDIWSRKDSLIAGCCLGGLFVFAFLAFASPITLTFYPYPQVSFPDFQWPIVLAVFLFSSPAWIRNDD